MGKRKMNKHKVTMDTQKSIAHKHDMNFIGQQMFPDGLVPWRNETSPNLTGGPDEQNTGSLRACDYCGSMHPADVAAAIRAGAHGSWADMKYGWPHKAYFDDIPNPHAGMLESRTWRTDPPPADEAGKWRRVHRGYDPHTGEPTYWWAEVGQPAGDTTHGKFYSVHLQDATDEDREIIEKHLGLHFEFIDDGQKVRWSPIEGES
jgi:hypothetical protein